MVAFIKLSSSLYSLLLLSLCLLIFNWFESTLSPLEYIILSFVLNDLINFTKQICQSLLFSTLSLGDRVIVSFKCYLLQILFFLSFLFCLLLILHLLSHQLFRFTCDPFLLQNCLLFLEFLVSFLDHICIFRKAFQDRP